MVGGATRPELVVERTYEVSTREDELGILKTHISAAGVPLAVGRTCWSAIMDRETRCANCPVLPVPADELFHVGIVGAKGDGSYVVAIGRRIGEARAQVKMESVGGGVLGQMLEVRLDAAARAASLSKREREVLKLLMLGRTVTEIGTALEISVRTVKYHQANILTKLGADSRLDLLRLLR